MVQKRREGETGKLALSLRLHNCSGQKCLGTKERKRNLGKKKEKEKPWYRRGETLIQKREREMLIQKREREALAQNRKGNLGTKERGRKGAN